MDSPTSQTPEHGLNPSDHDDASPSDNSDCFSVFSFETEEEDAPFTTITRSKNINNVPICVLSQDKSATNDSIWGCPTFFMSTTAGEKYVSEVHHHGHDQGSMDHQHRSNFSSRPLPYADPRFRPMMLHKFGNPMMYDPRIRSCPQAILLDVNRLEEIIKGGDGEQKESLANSWIRSLGGSCRGGDYFLRAAFDEQGAISIIELIRKVKRSSPGHALAMTSVLSIRFMDIMTHPTARDVILECLLLFPTQSNQVLYEKAILHFQDLATDQVGCRSLNDCIALIDGDQRVRLLNHIADVSDYLSYDQYGNYVVQNVLGLGNRDIIDEITHRLQNQFIRLATTKGGSHVVEKCMEASDNGIILVAAKILDRPTTPVRLARNQFGNYVIQAALRKTKERGYKCYYNALVRHLEPHRRALRQTAGGRNVLSSLEAEE
ncbi:Pumilio18 [Sesamum alatum]|uniref:Pumilio18 n=1 Tax=Sesamum alatum TaxID=300844 RepID=A0AAE1Y4L8_9LAMI|nr:Pumilio18 [Sesamum alatum]